MIRLLTKFRTGLACAALALVLLSISACGQKGDLYLPDRSAGYAAQPEQ